MNQIPTDIKIDVFLKLLQALEKHIEDYLITGIDKIVKEDSQLWNARYTDTIEQLTKAIQLYTPHNTTK